MVQLTASSFINHLTLSIKFSIAQNVDWCFPEFAVLFDRAGGKLKKRMSEVVSSVPVKSARWIQGGNRGQMTPFRINNKINTAGA